MSGHTRQGRLFPEELIELSKDIIYANEPVKAVKKYQALIDKVTASEVIALIDELVIMEIPMDVLKKGINKLLNLFFKALNSADPVKLPKGSFLDHLARNNAEMEGRLKELRPLIRELNKAPEDDKLKDRLLHGFEGLATFDNHYVLKENILFPVLEKTWPDYRCLQLMWSFHDDIRNNRKEIIKLLDGTDWDLKKFNRLAGDLFFNMLAIKFREEKILFPEVMKSIPRRELNKMLNDSAELDYPYIRPEFKAKTSTKTTTGRSNDISLETGILTAKQIKLLFNHLPVDITYVDENNKVRYFSSPKTRVFPRAKSIIGRDVKNCHPPSSVHIVEEIIEEFRKGKQDKASFWIKMGEIFVLIQYFAVRDKHDNYCGVVEVSQEVSEIRNLEGEQRLLDWNKD